MNNDNATLADKVLEGHATLEEVRKTVKWLGTPEGQIYLSKRLDKDFEQKKNPHVSEIPSSSMKGDLFKKLYWRNVLCKSRKYAIALILFLLIMCIPGYWYFSSGSKMQIQWMETYVPYGKRMHLQLSDGTSVYLGAGSHLRYPKVFCSKDRKVILSGEGYFDVKPDAHHPFYVNLGNVEVKVLGTSFSIMARRESPEISMRLDKGYVHILDGKKVVSMYPGDYMSYNKHTDSISISKTEGAVYADWKANQFYFNDAALSDVLSVLSRKYNVTFQIKDTKVHAFHYTMKLADLPLKDVLVNIMISTPIRFSKVKNVYYVQMK